MKLVDYLLIAAVVVLLVAAFVLMSHPIVIVKQEAPIAYSERR